MITFAAWAGLKQIIANNLRRQRPQAHKNSRQQN